jgi:NTE family protein
MDAAMNPPEVETPQPEPRRVLVLQGGGALGAYQAGVFEALSEAAVRPQWLAGISIGAINAALIAGNPPARQVERLREFWMLASQGPQIEPPFADAISRPWVAQMNAASTVMFGVPGFFTPRTPPPQFQLPGAPGAVSYYDTAPLQATLERLVDFDRLNDGGVRLSVGAVNIETGNFEYFENTGGRRIGAKHIMASGALPPGFPPVEIDGAWYWDGGLVSNTPLDFVLHTETVEDLAIFQVDLFPARGPLPRTLAEAADREMDIRYSSRTRLNTDKPLEIRHLKQLARDLIAALPAEIAAGEAARRLAAVSTESAVTVVQLIYRGQPHENGHRDYEFSRATMLHHWRAGVEAARRSLDQREAIMSPGSDGGAIKVFDGAQETSG